MNEKKVEGFRGELRELHEAICSECGGTGLSNNKAINSALDNAQRVFDDASNRLTEAQESYDQAETSLQKRNASIAIQRAMQDVMKARNDLNRLKKFKEQPVDEGDTEISGNPEELVYVDFWNPPIIKDQVQGVKGVKYADVIRAVQRSTGGQFFVNEECKAQFIPPNYIVPSTENAIEIKDNRSVRDNNKCNLCGKCADFCPNNAQEYIGKDVTSREIMKEIIKDEAFYEEAAL